MPVRWARPAQDDLLAIYGHIAADNRQAAERVGRALLAAANSLPRFPRRGRAGRVMATRELVVSRLPYIVIYVIEADGTTESERIIAILRVIHGAMHWPPEGNGTL